MSRLDKSSDYFDFVLGRIAICTQPWWPRIRFNNGEYWTRIISMFGLFAIYLRVIRARDEVSE